MRGLPPDAKRRLFTNLAVLLAVVVAFGAALHFGARAFLGLGALAVAYVPLYGAYRLWRADPPAPTSAWLLCGATAAIVVFAIVHSAVTGRVHLVDVLTATVFIWSFLIRERGIILSSAFARSKRAYRTQDENRE